MKAADFGTKADLQNGENPVSGRPYSINLLKTFFSSVKVKSIRNYADNFCPFSLSSREL